MSKLRKDLQLYALGMKGWVEVRVGKVLPKAHTTSTPKLIEETREQRRRIDDSAYSWGWRWEFYTVCQKRRIMLTTTIWEGGRVLGSMRSRRFRALSGTSTRDGHAIVVPTRAHAAILKELEAPNVT
jgi:hypothetical protein